MQFSLGMGAGAYVSVNDMCVSLFVFPTAFFSLNHRRKRKHQWYPPQRWYAVVASTKGPLDLSFHVATAGEQARSWAGGASVVVKKVLTQHTEIAEQFSAPSSCIDFDHMLSLTLM